MLLKVRKLLSLGKISITLFAGALAVIGYLLQNVDVTYTNLGLMLILASVAINGLPIIIGAIRGLAGREVNVDELVSIAIVASLASGHFLEAAVVSFVMVFGALIEEVTSRSARNAIEALIRITPQRANVVKGDSTVEVDITNVKPGDILLVRAGERIPVDAVIVKGQTSVDESSITGESIPIEKTIEDEVFAGTMNQSGTIRIRTTKIGQDTTLGKVIKLVTDAEEHKPESIALINRYARWFTPTILILAGLTLLITQSVDRAITVLIVGCPCALVLAVPTAMVASISKSAKVGILVKGGNVIDESARIDVMVFDKTGTLTEGEPKVDRIIPASAKFSGEFILQQASCVEHDSTHPLARAVMREAEKRRIEYTPAEDVMTEFGVGVKGCINGIDVEVGSADIRDGKGELSGEVRKALDSVEESGATPLLVYRDKELLGLISVTDQVKREARGSIEDLKALGISDVSILSGDHGKAVEQVARTVGINNAYHRLKPHEKLNLVREMQKAGKRVMYVGDGINDAPALAMSEVGVAMGAKGIEVALETADVALMEDDIAKLPFLVRLSRRTLKIVKFNIAFGVAFNALAIYASGSGALSPIMGAVVHNIGSVFVVMMSTSIVFGNYG